MGKAKKKKTGKKNFLSKRTSWFDKQTIENPVKKGVVSPQLEIPENIARPDYAIDAQPKLVRAKDTVMNEEQLERMEAACKLAREILDKTAALATEGVTTDELDRFAHKLTIEAGAYPAPYNYHNFPKSICTSVNEVICHGIPDSRQLTSGDAVNIDVTVYYKGMYGDCSTTVLIGDVSDENKKLVDVTYKSMMAGIEAVKPGAKVSDIGKAIEDIVHPEGYSIVSSYGGHGIGEVFHTQLHVAHYYDAKNNTELKPGMTFTIEPMINMGKAGHKLWKDGWTAATADSKRSAQFEHTVLVTEKGVKILTLPEGEPQPFEY